MTEEQRNLIIEFLAIPSWAINRKLLALDKIEPILKEIVKDGK